MLRKDSPVAPPKLRSAAARVGTITTSSSAAVQSPRRDGTCLFWGWFIVQRQRQRGHCGAIVFRRTILRKSSWALQPFATPVFECTRTGIAEGDSGFACWLLDSTAGGENNAKQRLVVLGLRLASALLTRWDIWPD